MALEDYFHVGAFNRVIQRGQWNRFETRLEKNTDRVLALFERHGVKATFFVLGWVAERYPRLVRTIAAAGHVIGSHGHRHDRVYTLDIDRFTADLRASIAALTGAGSGPITCYRAPEWSINERSPWALDVLAREGITLDSSRAPMRIVGDPAYVQHPHTIRTDHGMLIEAPPFVTRRLGQQIPYGGGWGLRERPPPSTLSDGSNVGRIASADSRRRVGERDAGA